MKTTKALILAIMIIAVWTQTRFGGAVGVAGPSPIINDGTPPKVPNDPEPAGPLVSQSVPDSDISASKADPQIGTRLSALSGISNGGIQFPIFPNVPSKDCSVCDCKCKTRYLSIRTAAHPKVPWNWRYYAYLGSFATASGWFYPAFFYYYLSCYPDFLRGDGFIGLEHCDGTWSFQNKFGNYLSGYRIYSKYNGCAERWRIIRNGSGSYIQNLWTGAYLWFNNSTYQWQIHPWLRTLVIVEFWPEYRF